MRTRTHLLRTFHALAPVALIVALSSGATRGAEPAAEQARALQMTVDFGDGVEVRFAAIPWREGMTGLDLVTAAEAHPCGLKFEKRGAGATAFVTRIGTLKNQGPGKDSKNWLYRVNSRQADEGIGAYLPKPGDVVLWKFSAYDYNREE